MDEINKSYLEVISNKFIGDKCYCLDFYAEDISVKPGQFLMLDCVSKENKETSSLTLKRPISFFRRGNKDRYAIMYKVKGKGTKALTHLKPNDQVEYMGPLGKPIDLDSICKKDDIIHLIAGGVGIAPISFLADHLINRGNRVLVYLGFDAVGSYLNYCLNNLTYLGIDSDEIHISLVSRYPYFGQLLKANSIGTYMGINTYIGNMISALDTSWLNIIKNVGGPVFACTPKPVTQDIHNNISSDKRDCYIFEEAKMACGVGVCCSCNINGVHLCKEGPCVNSKLIYGGVKDHFDLAYRLVSAWAGWKSA